MIKLDDIKIGSDNNSSFKRINSDDLIWGIVEEGKYNATLAIVYPWKNIVRDTKVRIKKEDGTWDRNSDGTYKVEDKKDVSWDYTNIVFRIDGGDYDGYAVKANLSTHPNSIGSAKQFLYNLNLFDVSLADLFKHTGTPAIVNVKVKTDRYTDKNTGEDVERTESYVSYYDKMDEEIVDTPGL